jgi:ribosomal protein S18 acetylase RimI-like enzyme
MQFELTGALVDDILFSMEDQEGKFLIDSRDGVIVEADEGMTGEHYLPLPEWDSSSGFRLMERFTAGLRNPLVREELSNALNRGKGVFRAFKDILSRHGEAEKLWFAYKEREMKREIIRWYNALREGWGLEQIGVEPEDTVDLVLEDFRFRPGGAEDEAAAAALHEICTGAAYKSGRPAEQESKDVFILAETIGGDFAGYISALEDGASFHVNALEVKDEYRGLGIGEALLSRFMEQAGNEKALVSIVLPADAEGFSRVLLRNSFTVSSVRYEIRPRE